MIKKQTIKLTVKITAHSTNSRERMAKLRLPPPSFDQTPDRNPITILCGFDIPPDTPIITDFRDSLMTKPVWWLAFIVFWSVFVGFSWRWNYDGLEREAYNMVEMTRNWNASHGDVYALISEDTRPIPISMSPKRILTRRPVAT